MRPKQTKGNNNNNKKQPKRKTNVGSDHSYTYTD